MSKNAIFDVQLHGEIRDVAISGEGETRLELFLAAVSEDEQENGGMITHNDGYHPLDESSTTDID